MMERLFRGAKKDPKRRATDFERGDIFFRVEKRRLCGLSRIPRAHKKRAFVGVVACSLLESIIYNNNNNGRRIGDDDEEEDKIDVE